MATTYTTVPGLDERASARVVETLSGRLVSLIDLSLTLKHVHWNVVGEGFIGVHEMLDPQVDKVRAMVDETAERVATLGGTPIGTPGHVAGSRDWDDYALGKALVRDHLEALNAAYDGVIADHRAAQAEVAETDPVSQDLLLEHLRHLELMQWLVRAHLENAGGGPQLLR